VSIVRAARSSARPLALRLLDTQ